MISLDLEPLATLVQHLQRHRPCSILLRKADSALGPGLVLALTDGLGPLAVLGVGLELERGRERLEESGLGALGEGGERDEGFFRRRGREAERGGRGKRGERMELVDGLVEGTVGGVARARGVGAGGTSRGEGRSLLFSPPRVLLLTRPRSSKGE
jgi:hypothetical protein